MKKTNMRKILNQKKNIKKDKNPEPIKLKKQKNKTKQKKNRKKYIKRTKNV